MKKLLLIVCCIILMSCENKKCELPKGCIIGWSSDQKIPDGWAICNGVNGTPNLVNKFPLGAMNASELTEMGGKTKYTLTMTNVNGKGVPDGYKIDSENDGNVEVTGLNHVHSINQEEIMPPFQKIIFIIKI